MKKSNILFLIVTFLTLFYSSINAQWLKAGPSGGWVYNFDVHGNTIYASSYGGVLVSTNGINWSHSNWGFMEGDVEAVKATSTKIYAGTWGHGLYMKNLTGGIWEPCTLPDDNIQCIESIGDNVFAGTYGTGIYLSTDNGSTWNKVNNGLTGMQVECLAVSGNNIFAGIEGKGVFLSTDSGTSWTNVNTGLPSTSPIAFGVNGTKLYVGLWANGIWVTSNNGQDWLNYGKPVPYPSSFAFHGSDLYVCGSVNGIYKTTNDGTDWIKLNNGISSTAQIKTIKFIGENLVVGEATVNEGSRGMYYSTNYGTDWTLTQLGLPKHVVNAITSRNGNIFAATSGGIYRSTDLGNNWNKPTIHGDYNWADFSAIAFINNNNGYAGDLNGYVYSTTTGGTEWTTLVQIEKGATISSFAFINSYIFASTTPYSADAVGGVYMSSDNGTNWTNVSTGLPTIADINTNVTSLAVIGSNLFAGTGHGVYLSTNNGTNWTKVNNGLTTYTVNSLAVKGIELFAGTDNGVYVSGNNGTSWKQSDNSLSAKKLIDYPVIPGSGGDLITRAFYITDYPGTTLSKVTLYFSATTGEYYKIQLQATNSTYDGTLIGQSTASFSSSTDAYDFKTATFNFNNAPVTKGQIIAFKLSLVSGGSGDVYFCVHGDTGSVSAIVKETEDATPPLSTPRRSAIAIRVDSGFSANVVSLAAIDTNIFAGTDGQGVFRLVNNDSSWINVGMQGNYITGFTAINDTLYAATNNNSIWQSKISGLITDVKWSKTEIPAGFSLAQNYPNPFNPSTTIEFHLRESSHITLKVFDILGREAATLINGNKSAGNYKIEFNASKLSSGVYFYRLQTEKYSATKKMILLK